MVPRRRRADLGRARLLGRRRLSQGPFNAAESSASGCPASRSRDGPRGVVVGNATCFPVSMARGATWDLDLEERIGEAIGLELRAVGANLYRRGVRQRAAPSRVGSGPGDLRRGPAPRRRARRRADPRAAAPRDGVREALRLQLDGERPVHASTSRSTRSRCTRCTSRTSGASSTRASPSVMSAYNSVNGEWCGQNQAAAHRRPPRRVGVRGLRDQRLDLRPARRGRSVAAGLDIEMPYRMVRAAAPARRARARRGHRGPTSTAPSSGSSPRCCASTTCCRAGARRSTCSASPEHRALAREAAARSVVLLRNEPVDGAPVLPLDRGDGDRSPCSAGWPTPSTSATAARATCGTSTCVTVLDGLRAACRVTSSTTTAPTSTRAAATRAASPTSPSSSSATRTLDEGEYIGDARTALFGICSPAPTIPSWSSGSKARPRERRAVRHAGARPGSQRRRRVRAWRRPQSRCAFRPRTSR